MRALSTRIKGYFDPLRAEPRDVALGAALAAFLGFVPLECGLIGLVVFVIGMTRASGIVAAVLGLVLKPLSVFVCDDTSVKIGRAICDSDWARNHAALWTAPGVTLLGLERYHVMGGAILGLVAAVPFYFVF